MNDMSIEQLTFAVNELTTFSALQGEQINQLSRRLREIECSLPDWLKNGNMYSPELLATLGVIHQVNPQNQIKDDEL